jgi:hypothetical protein
MGSNPAGTGRENMTQKSLAVLVKVVKCKVGHLTYVCIDSNLYKMFLVLGKKMPKTYNKKELITSVNCFILQTPVACTMNVLWL